MPDLRNERWRAQAPRDVAERPAGAEKAEGGRGEPLRLAADGQDQSVDAAGEEQEGRPEQKGGEREKAANHAATIPAHARI